MTIRTVTVQLQMEQSMCFIPVPFDPRTAFGKAKVPVKVTLNGYTFRSTIATMGGVVCIPLRKSNRQAAGLEGHETLQVHIALDEDVRQVEVPADLAVELQRAGASEAWSRLSYSARKELVDGIESAKKPDTRARRIALAVAKVADAG